MTWFLLLSFSGLLWSLRQLRIISFYLYLWQLKEYHLGRFLDHFRTEKGKRLILHPLKISKIVLLLIFFGFCFWPELALMMDHFWLLGLILLYITEALIFFRDIGQGRVKRPVFTLKTIWLFFVCTACLALLAWSAVSVPSDNIFIVFLFSILTIDILSPLIISLIVLSLQPLSVAWRLVIIEKAKRKRAKLKNLIVVGITGSFGKTSVKEFLATILAEKFKVAKTSEHQNSEIGISRAVLNLKESDQVFICEMGAYGKGRIKFVSEIVHPQVAVITGVNEQHLALFGSMENLLSAEGGIELLKSLGNNETAILNGNSYPLVHNIKESFTGCSLKQVWCSTKAKLDLWAENIKVEKQWLYFRVAAKTGETADFKVNLVGQQNVENLLLAAACAKELGMNLEEISRACDKIKQEQGAMKLSKESGGVDIIDSTYSANPNGVMAALEHLTLWSGRKVVIMPCLIELGPASKDVHRRIGRKIGETCDLAIITTKDWFREMKKSALDAGMKPENILFLENSDEIVRRIEALRQNNNVLLLEGRISPSLVERIKQA